MKEDIPESSFENARLKQVLDLALHQHRDAAKLLLHKDLGLNGDWRNVSSHCLNVAFIGDELSRALQLSDEERAMIVSTLIVHDALKRIDINPGQQLSQDQIAQSKVQYENTVQLFDPDGLIRSALSEDNAHLDTLTLPQSVARLADNLSMEDTICPLSERLEEVRRRRESKGQDLRKEHNNPHYWEDELRQSNAYAQVCVKQLQARGYSVTTETLPAFIIRRILNRIGTKDQLQKWDTSALEMLSSSYFAQVVQGTPRRNPEKDEDDGWCFAKGNEGWCLVTDGATAIEAPQYFTDIDESPGCMASHLAMSAAKECIQTQSDVDPFAVISHMNTALQNTLKDLPIEEDDKSRVFSTCALVVKLKDNERGSHDLSFANAGDTALVIMKADGSFEWLAFGQGEDLEVRENVTAFQELQKSSYKKMEDVLPHLSEFPNTLQVINDNRRAENTSMHANVSLKGGDTEQLKSFMQSGVIEVHSGDTVFALTDGALPWVTMQQGRQQFVEDALRDGGPAELQRRRQSLGEENTEQDNPPCLKKHDDLRIVAMHIL